MLVSNAGEEILRAGDCAGFMPGDEDGHHLQNRTGQLARVLEIGSANLRGDEGRCPDIDLISNAAGYFRKDGTLYR